MSELSEVERAYKSWLYALLDAQSLGDNSKRITSSDLQQAFKAGASWRQLQSHTDSEALLNYTAALALVHMNGEDDWLESMVDKWKVLPKSLQRGFYAAIQQAMEQEK